MNGRPLRFLGIALAGWTAARAIMLWPAAGPAAIPRALVPAAFAREAPAPSIAGPEPGVTAPFNWPMKRFAARPATQPATIVASHGPDPDVPGQYSTAPATPAQSRPVMPPPLLAAPPAVQRTAESASDRWSASAWLVVRDGRGLAPGLGGGQLGGSQAGLRLAYSLDRRTAIVARIATPLRGQGREAALGIEWRPTKLPVRLVAEYRQSLDGGGSGPAAGVIAGTGPAPLALGFDLETYGQAGVIRRRRAEPFAEGAARLSHPVARLGGIKVDLGLGGWGGAQRGAQRVDVGPSLGVRVPVAGKSLRLSLDWRQRVAGNARPGSGPVLVVGSDF